MITTKMSRRRLLGAGAAALCTPMLVRRAMADVPALRVAFGKDRYNMDDKNFTFTLRGPSTGIAEGVVAPGGDYFPVPNLFVRWTVADGLYRADIRPGVTFHDGTPLDAAAMVKSLAYVTQSFIGLDQASVKATGPMSLEFRSKSGSLLMIENMAHRMGAIFDTAVDRKVRPTGTGPYKFVRYEPQVSIEVERNEAYWGSKPRNQRVLYRFVPDSQARLIALLKGEIDIIGEADPQLLLSLPPDGKYEVHTSRPVQYVALLVNIHGEAPFAKLQDRRLREAIAYAIDREAIARVMFLGKGVPAKGILPGWMFGLGDDSVTGFGYDRAKAESLLDQAGWTRSGDGTRQKGGEALRIRLVAAYPYVSWVKPMPEMLQQMLKAVGIDVELVETDDDGVYYDQYMKRGQADLFMEIASNNNSDPTYLLYNLYHSRSAWLDDGYKYTVVGPEFDRALDRARATTDRAVIVAEVRKAHRLLIDEVIATIPILMTPNFAVSRPGITVPMFEHRDYIPWGDAVLA
ncbi:MAG: ABC transporter substrate-binding protein [Dongiaceae bacterium]